MEPDKLEHEVYLLVQRVVESFEKDGKGDLPDVNKLRDFLIKHGNPNEQNKVIKHRLNRS